MLVVYRNDSDDNDDDDDDGDGGGDVYDDEGDGVADDDGDYNDGNVDAFWIEVLSQRLRGTRLIQTCTRSPDTDIMKFRPAAALSAAARWKYRQSGQDCASVRRAGPPLLKDSQLTGSGKKKRLLLLGSVCCLMFQRYGQWSARAAAS